MDSTRPSGAVDCDTKVCLVVHVDKASVSAQGWDPYSVARLRDDVISIALRTELGGLFARLNRRYENIRT